MEQKLNKLIAKVRYLRGLARPGSRYEPEVILLLEEMLILMKEFIYGPESGNDGPPIIIEETDTDTDNGADSDVDPDTDLDTDVDTTPEGYSGDILVVSDPSIVLSITHPSTPLNEFSLNTGYISVPAQTTAGELIAAVSTVKGGLNYKDLMVLLFGGVVANPEDVLSEGNSLFTETPEFLYQVRYIISLVIPDVDTDTDTNTDTDTDTDTDTNTDTDTDTDTDQT